MSSVWHIRRDRLRRDPRALWAGLVVLLLVLFSAAAPLAEWISGLDASRADLLSRYDPPSGSHWLGTDEAGRDVLLRLMYGGQVSLLVGLCGALTAALVGTAVGLVAGYGRGRVDAILMRVTDGILALPLLPLLIVLAAVDLSKLGLSEAFVRSSGAGLIRIVVIVGLVQWTTVARLVRAEAIRLMARDDLRAAQAFGAGPGWILRVHLLPGCATPVIVATTLAISQVVLFESVLSFLGLGVAPPVPSWGNMLSNAQELATTAPALAIYPGLLIFATVASFNVLGDALRSAFDPRATGIGGATQQVLLLPSTAPRPPPAASTTTHP